MAFIGWELPRLGVKFVKSFSVSLWDSLSLSGKAPFAQREGSAARAVDWCCEAEEGNKGNLGETGSAVEALLCWRSGVPAMSPLALGPAGAQIPQTPVTSHRVEAPAPPPPSVRAPLRPKPSATLKTRLPSKGKRVQFNLV